MSGIRVELELDTGEFTSRMLHAGETVRRFNDSLGQGYTRIRRVTEGASGFLASLRDLTIVLGLARAAIDNIHRATTGWAADIVKVNADMERTVMLLRGMSDAVDPVKEAADQFKFLRDFALQAPFSLKQLQDTFVKLKATGVDPLNGSLKAYTEAIAAVGGSDEQLHRVTIAITQMSGKGVIQMEELRQQLGEHVPRAVRLMARATGQTMGQLIAAISTGTVEAKSTLRAMEGEFLRVFGGSSAAMMQTFAGRISQMRTLLQNFALKIGETGFFDAVKNQLRDFNEFLMSPQAERYARMIGEGLKSVVLVLRDIVDWVIRFRSEIMTAAQILATAFAGRMLVGALQSIGSAFAAVSTEIRFLTLNWTALQTRMASFSMASAVAQLYGASTAVATLGLHLRNAVAMAGMFVTVAGSIASIAIPLATAIIGAAAAFGLFTNQAKSAYDNLVRFGAESRRQVELSKTYIADLEKRLEAANRMLEARLRDRRPGARNEAYWRERLGINQLEAALKEARERVAAGEAEVQKREVETFVRARMEAIDAGTAGIRARYDAEAKIRDDAHQERMKRLAAEKRDTQVAEREYQEAHKAAVIKFHEDELAIIEAEMHRAKIMREAGNREELAAAQKLDQELLARHRAVREQLRMAEQMPAGLVTVDKILNIDKLLERGQKKLEEIRSKIAEGRAELAGASGETAKLVYLLEEASKYGPADNEKVRALNAELIRSQKLLDDITAQLEGQTKFDRELQRLYEKTQADVIAQQTRGKSEVEKLAIMWNSGAFNGAKGSGIIARMLQGIGEAATGAATGMDRVFNDAMASKANRMVEIVSQLNNVWTGFRNNVEQTDIESKLQPTGVQPLPTYTGGTYTENLIRRESGGNPNAVNGRAVGLGQFMEKTWMDFLKDVRPNLIAAGEKAALDMRRDPLLMRQAIEWYAAKNAERLRREQIAVNDANLYLAHFLGPDGAVATLKRSNDALLSMIPEISAARSKNPQIFGDLITVGDLKSWARSFMGTGLTAPVSGEGATSPLVDQMMRQIDPQRRALLQEIIRLMQEANRLGKDNALIDQEKKIQEAIRETLEAREGLANKEAEIRSRIRKGEFGPDTDPESERYKNLIRLVKELDEVEQKAAERKRLRERLKRFTDSREREDEILAQREADLRRRFENESTFKPSNQYFRELAEFERLKELLRKGQAEGMTGIDYEAEFARLERNLQRVKDLEVASVIQTEQAKIRQIERSLMTEEEAREASYREEVRRLEDLLKFVSDNAEQRAAVEAVIQARIRAERRKTDATSPAAKQMRDWADISNNIARSWTSWMDNATDRLAEFVATGKAEFSSLADSIIRDMARMAIRGATGWIYNALGGGIGKAGSAVPMNIVPVRHGGGAADWSGPHRLVPMSIFDDAERFHDGLRKRALGLNEVPVIAKKGELIGWPEQMAKQFGGGVGVSNSFTINVNAAGGSPEQNQDLAERIGRAIEDRVNHLIGKQFRTQLRPGGLLNRR